MTSVFVSDKAKILMRKQGVMIGFSKTEEGKTSISNLYRFCVCLLVCDQSLTGRKYPVNQLKVDADRLTIKTFFKWWWHFFFLSETFSSLTYIKKYSTPTVEKSSPFTFASILCEAVWSVMNNHLYCWYCWFASDGSTTMLVHKKKSFSLRYELNFFQWKLAGKNGIVLWTNMAALSRVYKPIIYSLSGRLVLKFRPKSEVVKRGA